jgi:hypothetical protein
LFKTLNAIKGVDMAKLKRKGEPLYYVIIFPDGYPKLIPGPVVETFKDKPAAERRAQMLADAEGKSAILATGDAVFSSDMTT